MEIPIILHTNPKTGLIDIIMADVGVPFFHCFIPGQPPTTTTSNEQMPIYLPNKNGGRGRALIVQSKKGKQLSRHFQKHFEKTHQGNQPYEEAAIMFLTYIFPHKTGCPKKNREKFIPYLNTPDSDNIVKKIGDSLQDAGVIKNDYYLTTAVPTRLRGPDEYVGITIVIAPLSIKQKQ